MFLPLDRPLDWRDPPVATLALTAVCVLVFLVFQTDDGRSRREAVQFYYDSGLAAIELPRYQSWLERHGREARCETSGAWEGYDAPSPCWLFRMQSDPAFMRALRAGEIITAEDDGHSAWRFDRRTYERKRAANTTEAWGLKSADFSWSRLLTHQFLHGGWGHLFGNMLFLVAVGLLLEAAVGAGLTAAFYLLGGVAAAAVHMIFQPASLVPMVGASGAIAGLMGAMTVAYGLRPVRFFYTVGVWFDYVRAPAIVLLPLWFGKELLSWWLYADESAVAFTAHMGGLVGGAFLATATRLVRPSAVRPPAEADSGAQAQAALAAAQDALRRLDFDTAARGFRRLLTEGDTRDAVLRGLYDAQCHQPASEAYHAAAAEVLARATPERRALVDAVYADYRHRARPRPRLEAASLRVLARYFLATAQRARAAEVLTVMSRAPNRFPHLATRLEALAGQYEAAGEGERAERWRAQARAVRVLRQGANDATSG
ncbi:rhomboid family intramembrane serine protease [Arhodomonas sp. AD133]|uniref:rhomboid family intramembrane serine protease n=1 Tax=Arhodomonas sp. AD133 TaxID=3415009 RepID=UPI003EBD7C68